MKLPGSESANDLIKRLSLSGYNKTRQSGSHIRLPGKIEGREHHLTIPNHNPIQIGTLSDILKEDTLHHGISKEEIITKLYS